MRIELKWSAIKNLKTSKKLGLQFVKVGSVYKIWLQEKGVFYVTEIETVSPVIVGSDQEDFENNFKTLSNLAINPTDEDGKAYVRSESRPLNMTTYFTMAGDKLSTPQDIGNGAEIRWDFSNTTNDIVPPSGFKKKRIEFQFIDGVRLKEGSIYFFNAPKGCYLGLQVVCPAGSYYLDNNKIPVLASSDTVVSNFVNHHFITGDCPMGDELNTEAASDEIPSYYKFWLDITTPVADIVSHGYVSVEVYRQRTKIL